MSATALLAAALWMGVASAITGPACQLSAAPQQPTLNNVRTAFASTPPLPLGIVTASQPGFAFVSFSNGTASTLGVLNTTTFPPTLLNQVLLPPAFGGGEGATGLTLSQNGSLVFIAANAGAVIVNATRAIAASPNAVVGTLNGTTQTQKPGVNAFGVTVSKDDKYVFVAQEYGPNRGVTPGNIDVFKLQGSTPDGSVSGSPVGFVSLGFAVTGSILSPDGRFAYATSEVTSQTAPVNRTGFVSTLDVATLESDPSQAVLTNSSAGCSPVRAIVTADGKTLWATARESNRLLAFDMTKLVTDPGNALLASIQVGTAPVGLIFARNESRIITADSNRFNYTGAVSGLSVVDVRAALAGSGTAVLGRVPTGLFPRNLALSHDGSTVLVTDYMSAQIQAVDVSTLP